MGYPLFYHHRLALANCIERWSASLMWWLRNAGVPEEIRRDDIITLRLARQMALMTSRKVEERHIMVLQPDDAPRSEGGRP